MMRQLTMALGLLLLLLNIPVSVLAISKEEATPTRQGSTQSIPVSTFNNSVSLQSVRLKDNSHSGDGDAISYRRRVQLILETSGQVSQYRIGENAQLSGSSWQTFPSGRLGYEFASDTEGTKTVYVQVRGLTTDPQKFSAIRSDTIVYRKLPEIINFRLDNGAGNATKRDVSLSWSINGTATHYRVSENRNFSGVNWMSGATPSVSPAMYTLAQGSYGSRTVYLQVKRDNSPPVSASDSINISFGICPVGHHGLECGGSEAGTCNVNGSCDCKGDFSGPACKTTCQRCYGAAGTHCGLADNLNVVSNPGVCVNVGGKTLCPINAGSWAHDECCVKHRWGGPNSNQASCSVGKPPYMCLGDLAIAVDHLRRPELTWTREVDRNKTYCTEAIEMPVNHTDMCNPSGGTLLCKDSQLCCSRSAQLSLVQGTSQPFAGIMCVCD